MIAWFLSWLPRRWLRSALYHQWYRTLPFDEQMRLDHWGASGNPDHHFYAWADELPEPEPA